MEMTGIVAFAFGVPGTIRSNHYIALLASHKARELRAPVYTQLDVCVEAGPWVTYTNEKPKQPPPTLRIARGAIQWAKQQRLTELLVIAAEPHLWRCLRDLNYAAREAGMKIEIRACEDLDHYPKDEGFWFCFNSTQERTRSRKAWDKRERILKLMPFFLYKLIAS